MSKLVLVLFLVLMASCAHPRSKPSVKTVSEADAPQVTSPENPPGAVSLRPFKGKPDHVMILVFDSMRPDYIERFNLKNFKALQKKSVTYKNAIVGYMGAETVVSHLVIPSGQEPKNLPWQDDVFYDRKGTLGAADRFYSTGNLSRSQLWKLMQSIPAESLLPGELRRTVGGKVFSVAQKPYAALAMGTHQADSIVTMKKVNGKCFPDGIKIPFGIWTQKRFELECSEKYGTEKTYYPLDGNRFVPGNDPEHQGGDVWVADVALEIMAHEDWSGLFLSFGGMDKIGHMLGQEDGRDPTHTKTEWSLEKISQTADAQLGKIMKELETRDLLKRTILVVTADHGGQEDVHYLGNGTSGKWGSTANEKPEIPSEWVKKYAQAEHIKFSLQDSAIRIWLKEPAASHQEPVLSELKKIPGVASIYQLEQKNSQWGYAKIATQFEHQSHRYINWANEHDLRLINAMATENAPNLVALLGDGVGFDLLGDHGGTQEKVQRIPLFMMAPALTPAVEAKEVGLKDVKGLIESRLSVSGG